MENIKVMSGRLLLANRNSALKDMAKPMTKDEFDKLVIRANAFHNRLMDIGGLPKGEAYADLKLPKYNPLVAEKADDATEQSGNPKT